MVIKISFAAARVNAGLTQKQLGEKCGVSESTVINWESGKSVPKISMIPILEEAFGIPIDYVRFPC